MLFIDNDEAEIADRAKDRRSGTDSDKDLFFADSVPRFPSLSLAHAVVKDSDFLLESAF
jgi:hypothetical protein